LYERSATWDAILLHEVSFYTTPAHAPRLPRFQMDTLSLPNILFPMMQPCRMSGPQQWRSPEHVLGT
ncbi:unnamed protein product, partial [marine sediment metagenome]